MEEAQAAANNETKSSAGDKYETGRAVYQNERDLHARQLVDSINIKKTLLSINQKKTCKMAELGAVVDTTTVSYFISVSLGTVSVEGKQIMAISAISPIAQAMLGLTKGARFEWMKKKVDILTIY